MTGAAVPTMGVEEEFFLVDPVSRTPQPASRSVVPRAAAELGELVSGEFALCQLEVKTPPRADADQVRADLVRLRAAADAAAAAEGLRLCASGTPVLAGRMPPPIGDHPRYAAGLAQFRSMMDDFAVCSMHVHVHVPDPEVAVRVSNHLRPWLSLLVGLSANSPFSQGVDTGYASWRAVIRSRFPCLGPPPYAESLCHHQRLAVTIADSGAMLDADTPFWDIRLNPRLPTVEVRAMDVTADVDDAVALATVVRALVMTALPAAMAGDPGPRPSSELLRAAGWRAARDGWSGGGVDALTSTTLPVPDLAATLVDHIAAATRDSGDDATVDAFVERLARRGNGADLQRASAARGGLTAVVDDLIALTART